MTLLREPLRFLQAGEMEILHRNALRILADTGMRIDHDEALEILKSEGCRVDFDKRHVLFPGDVVQNCVERMKQAYSRRKVPERMAVRYSYVSFRSAPFQIHQDFTVSAGGYCVFIYDLDGRRRRANVEDVRTALKLAHQLDQITYTGLPVSAQEIPLPIRQIHMAAELVKHTDKLGGIETFDAFDIKYICRIGEVVRGSRKTLREQPILVGYAEARSPLCFDNNMCEVFLEYLRQGMPQSLDTMPNAGLTAPVNPAGALAQGLAETLGGLTLAYAYDKDAVVTLDVTPSFADMSTGIYRYAGAERYALLGARIQMISEYYGCPSGVHGGKTDACAPDLRCGMEKGMTMLMPVLCGAVGFGTVGHLENAVTFSPLQLVLDNEIARYVRRAVKGFEISDEAVNAELVNRVGPGSSFLGEPETAQQYRQFINLAPFFKVEPWGESEKIDQERLWISMARKKVEELLAREHEPVLSDDQIQAVDDIVAEAEAERKAQGLL